MTKIAGTFPVLPTIFTASSEVDEAGFRRVAEWAIASGVDGIVFPGLASEYDHLTLEERLRLVALVGDIARGRVAFVAGCGGHTDEESAEVIRAAAAAGAVAAMVVTPARKGNDPAELARFYNYLSEAAPVPIMLQNAPKPMGLGLTPAEVLDVVARAPGIRYVKEENIPCGQRITALREAGAESLEAIFGGAGGRYITDELARGADGTMPAVEIADLHVALIAASRRDDWATVRRLFERTLPLLNMQAVYRWRLTKEVLLRRGLIDSAYVRAPGPVLDRHDLKELDELMTGLADLIGHGSPEGAKQLSAVTA
ncbi:dihydrodipicolinate synthase family protein [Sphingomonas sp. 3-13AW]|uniref:dihydrodipicolinate synthase family protein n=1 Tax=Sphingomonas sp. 3-13AW TaxID=3050450 RepID=UPI003BB7E435